MATTAEQKAKNAAYYRAYYAKNKDKIRLRIRNKHPSKNPRLSLTEEERIERTKARKKKNTRNTKYRSKEGRIRYMLFKARTRAKEKGMEFSININDLSIPDVCPLLEIPIIWDVCTGIATANSPSLDRIDNTKGYVQGNVWVISMRANFIKTSATPEELEKLAANLKFFTVKSNS